MTDFTGNWFTTFGPMELTQHGAGVDGAYHPGNAECRIEGEVKDGRLVFRYEEPDAAGEGWFEMSRHGRFAGRWRQDGDPHWRAWVGEREFDGVWDSTFGLLKLIQEPDRVHGFYDGPGSSNLEGRLQNGRLTFRYREPRAHGEGFFELRPDGLAFRGEWRQEPGDQWRPWTGRRVRQQPGLRWLVVVEAHWQKHLSERDYSFGGMLREFFARVPGVEVRHRFFNSADDLGRWCRELMYLPEPVALVLASHGTEEGLSAHGETVPPAVLVDNLRHADSLTLLHFSACLLLQESPGNEFAHALQRVAHYPISGYTTSVDWAASALIEFTYLDMVLSKDVPPADAAAQVPQLIAFAGDEAPPGSPFRGAGFRVLLPPGGGGRET